MAAGFSYQGITTDTDYRYNVNVSNTNTPRLKNRDGSDFGLGVQALVMVSFGPTGTGTGDCDGVFIIGYNGNGSSTIRTVRAPYPASSNRPAMAIDGSGYPYFYSGHPSDYRAYIRVIKASTS